MKLTITGRQVVVTPTIHGDITTKLARLDRVLHDGTVSAQCVIGRERESYVCELTVHARGDHMLHGVGRDARLPNAVAGAIERVSRQAQKLADRWKTRKRVGQSTGRRAARPEPGRKAGPRVVRARDYAVKPMTIEDAVLEFATVDRAFLVFREASSERIVVLYRRPDGRFGLIDPGA